MRRRTKTTMIVALWAIVLSACGGETIVDPPDVDLVAPFVGTWDATVFDVTSDADTSVVADLTIDGEFVINVQASGLYTATLTFGGIPIVEIGQLRPTSDGFVTLQPNGGDPATSAFDFVRADYLTLDGPTEFDFNLDTVLDPAQAYIELQRRN